MPEPALALTLDIGTSSTRALIWDTAGREIEGVRAQTKYEMHKTSDGGVEMPAADFARFVGECIDQALQQAGARAARIRAVGISTYWHSLVGLDAAGEPITPIYSWADMRARAAARRLRSEWDEAAVHARTGCMIHPSYYPAKLSWLKHDQPNLYARVARWASPAEYLAGLLFGSPDRRVSVSMASGTGLFNQEQCGWDAEILQALGLQPDRLAPIVDLTEPSRGLRDPFAGRWPALKDVPFFPAVGDGACGNIGSGCVSPARMAINLGTSGAIRVVWDESGPPRAGLSNSPEGAEMPKAAPAGLWRYRVDARRPIIGAAFSDGGNVFAWVNSVLRLPAPDEFERQLAAREPSPKGLIFLPFLAGERSLGWNPDARAALVGMNLSTGPTEIAFAALEAVALRFAMAAGLLRNLFPSAHEIIASGAALSHSPAWAQMFADAIGQPVTLAAEPEASSRGAALLAMAAGGLIASVDAAPAQLGTAYTPNPARRERYVEILAEQQALYAKLQ